MPIRLDERVLKCVAFLTLDHHDPAEQCIGTAFFVAFPDAPSGPTYLVTAAHCIEGTKAQGTLYVRLNRHGTDAGFEDVAVPQDTWLQLRTEDVAIRRFDLGDRFDHIPLDGEHLDITRIPSSIEVGVGDSVYMMSLFLPRPGERRALPIARFGNISAMRGERVPIQMRNDAAEVREIDAYLVEARSWAGQSGAPVIFYVQEGREKQHDRYLPGFGRVLGVVSGHYPWRDQAHVKGNIPLDVQLNSGIAIVNASEYILQLVRSDLSAAGHS
jgi:hypothetical protein